MATASTTLPSSPSVTTSLQSDHRQGSRKRKQDMPSSTANTSVAGTPSSVTNRESHERTPQISTKYLTACISAVVSFNIPEHIVKRCAEDMLNKKKTLTSATLLQECESHYPQEDEQSCSYLERVTTNNNSDDSDLDEVDAGAATLSTYLSENSLAPSTNTPGFISSSSHPSSSRHTNGAIHGGSRRNSSVDSTVPNGASNSYISAQNREPLGDEDCTDGHSLLSLGGNFGGDLNGSAQLANADSSTVFNQSITSEVTSSGLLNMSSSVHSSSHNGLNRPSRASSLMSPAGNQAAVAENTAPAHAERDSRSPRQHRSGGSSINTSDSGSAHSHAHSNSTDLENSAVSDPSGDVNSIEQATAQLGRGSMATARHSFSNTAEYMNTCFRLIEREHELLEKSRKCSLCSEKPREVTFLPCGHFTVCRRCAEPIYVCPSCNKNILATVDTYLS